MVKLFVLEDDPERKKWFLSVFADCEITFSDNANQSIEMIREGEYELIFLDRDIGHPTESGEDVAWVMKQEELAKNACIVVHTVNPRGQRNMQKYLESYHENVHVIDFTQLRKMKRDDFKLSL